MSQLELGQLVNTAVQLVAPSLIVLLGKAVVLSACSTLQQTEPGPGGALDMLQHRTELCMGARCLCAALHSRNVRPRSDAHKHASVVRIVLFCRM